MNKCSLNDNLNGNKKYKGVKYKGIKYKGVKYREVKYKGVISTFDAIFAVIIILFMIFLGNSSLIKIKDDLEYNHKEFITSNKILILSDKIINNDFSFREGPAVYPNLINIEDLPESNKLADYLNSFDLKYLSIKITGSNDIIYYQTTIGSSPQEIICFERVAFLKDKGIGVVNVCIE